MNEVEVPRINSRDYRAVTNKFNDVWCHLCGLYIPAGERVWWNVYTRKVICEECGIRGCEWERRSRSASYSSDELKTQEEN